MSRESQPTLLPSGRRALLVASVLAALLWPAGARAGREAEPLLVKAPLTVGVLQAPPFSMKDQRGEWEGISIDLWKGIARELNLRYQFRELDVDGLLAGVNRGSIDVAAAPITITPERERLVDFSHIFYASGLGLAVAKQSELDRWVGVFRAFFTTGFLRVLLVITLLLLLVGAAIWLFERRHNPGHFGGKPLAGIGSGFWFSTATLSGLSYGDKIPVTAGGRAVTILWMLASLIVVAGFTAFVTSRLTISHFEAVRGREDLPRLLVATVEGSPGEDYLRRERIQMRVYPTLAEAMSAVARRETDAVVYSRAILKYTTRHDYRGKIAVLPDVLEQQYFAFALPNGSRLREPLNLALLDITGQPTWRQTESRYLGE